MSWRKNPQPSEWAKDMVKKAQTRQNAVRIADLAERLARDELDRTGGKSWNLPLAFDRARQFEAERKRQIKMMTEAEEEG